MMNKSDAVSSLVASEAALGALLQPARLQAALRANDRLKLYLTVLQAAATHAQTPQRPLPDLRRDIRAADITARAEADWLAELPATASPQGTALHIPELPRLAARLAEDLATMAGPVLERAQGEEQAGFSTRLAHWRQMLAALQTPTLEAAALEALTHARREQGDSLHLAVMDLHKALNRLARTMAGTSVDGAHTWQLAADGSDLPRVQAFMRGLARTRALKLDHPGLDTSVTREGPRLMVQNDIGTNDAHVLVIQVDTAAVPMRTTLTYSDLHRQRFAFFQRQLQAVGASWSAPEARRSANLNQGQDYVIGSASFEAADEATLAAQLEGIGERIVFLIDWNRARKRLLPFVDKAGAVAVLEEAARRGVGHCAWLMAGAERLVWNVMAAQGAEAFRLGDRLDDVLGAEAARGWLVELLALAWRVHEQGHPAALVADEAHALLARRLRARRRELDLLDEHAALIHALGQALRDAVAHGLDRDETAAAELAARAKTWERQADHLVMQARAEAERQPQGHPMLRLLERSDDVADALEEACFLLSLLAEHFGARRAAGAGAARGGFSAAVRATLGELAETLLQAVQDHVKAVAVARAFGEGADAADHDEFLAACWRVLQAERHCDGLLRGARRALAAEAREQGDAVALTLGTDLAGAVESASDALLLLCHGLREHMLRQMGHGHA